MPDAPTPSSAPTNTADEFRPAPTNGVLIDAAVWLLHRNPLYLLSAAAMALGARLLLVHPDTRAGDLGNILLTLVVLQLYEVVVTGILLTLHSFRKSPEDIPSLLMVAVIFWTGPLVATSELIARDHEAGIGLSLGLLCLAVGEFEFVRRRLKLQLSGYCRAVAACTLVLVAMLPPLLVSQSPSGRANELTHLAGWWGLAAIVLLAAHAVRYLDRRVENRDRGMLQRGLNIGEISTTVLSEFSFLGLLIATTCAHLIAMNHAFFLHATAAYAAPTVILLTVVFVEGIRVLRWRLPEMCVPIIGFPALGLLLASSGFDPKFVEPLLPRGLRQPIQIAGILAGLTWWYAAWRGHGTFFLHLGSATVAVFGAYLIQSVMSEARPIAGEAIAASTSQIKIAWIAVAAATYFAISAIIRRSRLEGMLALVLIATAAILPTWRQVSWDRSLAGIVIFWSWLAMLLFFYRQFSSEQIIWWTAYGVLMTIVLDFHDPSRTAIRVHAPLIPLALAAIGYWLGRKEYVLLALSTLLTIGVFLLGREAVRREVSAAAVVVLGSFTLLAFAAVVSWFKREIMNGLVPVQSDQEST